MKEKKITLIILFVLFIVFSFFSCFSYKMLMNKVNKNNQNLQKNIGKQHEMDITFQQKKETVYNKKKNIKLNYSYYDTNIIIPGNDLASSNIKQYLKQEMTLDESIKKETENLKMQNKEYILDHDMKILYLSNKVISFSYKLLGYIEEYEINKLKVFSLNINTGVRLFYKDISSNPKKLKTIIKNYVKKELVRYDQKNTSVFAKIDTEIEKENFYLDKENLVVVINRCDLLDCFYGNKKIKIPYKDISDVLNSKYYEKRFL